MAKFPNIIVDKVAHSRIRLSILSDSTYIDTIKNSIDAYSIAYNVKKRDVYDLIGILPQNISAELTGRRAIKGSHKSYMRVLCSTDDERDKFSEK